MIPPASPLSQINNSVGRVIGVELTDRSRARAGYAAPFAPTRVQRALMPYAGGAFLDGDVQARMDKAISNAPLKKKIRAI